MALLTWVNSNKFDILRDKINAIVNLLNTRGLVPKNVYFPYDGDVNDITLWDADFKGVVGSVYEGYAIAKGQTFVYNSITYNLPDLRESFLRGASDSIGVGTFGGEASVTLTGKQSGLRAHIHTEALKATGTVGSGLLNFSNQGSQNTFEDETSYPKKVDGVSGRDIDTSDELANGLPALESHNNIPPYYAVHYIKRFI